MAHPPQLLRKNGAPKHYNILQQTMAAYFSQAIDKYFAAWILPETWYKAQGSELNNFYRFVMAVHRYSKLVNKKGAGKYLTDNEGNWLKDASGGLIPNGDRNPRTYDERSMQERIIRAAMRNHDFTRKGATPYARDYAKRAMEILDFLWVMKQEGFPHLSIQNWNPPLE